MSDISANDIIEDSSSVSDNSEILEHLGDQEADFEENVDNENIQTVLLANDSIDYSNYFENLQTIGIFISGLLVAYGLAFAFFKGLKK